MKTPINEGILQSDLDFAGFTAVNFPGVEASNGIPAGGTTGQVLSKTSDTDFETDWATVAAGGGADANTVTAEDIGLVGDGVTDNTAALQAWLDDVEAAQENATLLVPDGVYVFSGALQDGSGANAQIILPSVAITDPTYSVTIKGYHPISLIPWPGESMPVPKGPVFKSTLASGSGTRPSFIGGIGPGVPITAPTLSFLSLCFQDIIFQLPSNPVISGLNLSNYSTIKLLGDVLVMSGNGVGSDDSTEPSTSTSYGILLPPSNQAIVQQLENVNIWNFYTGIFVGELTHITNIGCYMCKVAMEFGFSYHSTIIERFEDWWCPTGIKVGDTHPFQIEQHDIERAAAGEGWQERVYDIDDAGNKAIADVTWWTVLGGVGAVNDYDVNGATGVKTRRIGSDASTIYVGTDMRLTSITGGGKLQVRNPGTGLWADADQWTNP